MASHINGNSTDFQQPIQVNNKEDIKVKHHGPYEKEIHWWPVYFPYIGDRWIITTKGPVMRKSSSCHVFVIT